MKICELVILLLLISSVFGDQITTFDKKLPFISFDEGYSPLFGDDNLMVLRDGKSVHLSLDKRTGLSLKMQELTAIYLVTRLLSIFAFRADIHLVLDSLSVASTLWVIYMMRFKLKSSYMEKLDSMPLYYVLVPCAIIGLVGHPRGPYNLFFKLMWSFTITVEAVAVLPQLRLIQNAKMVEPFTAHYVFALGVARFFACANWIIQLIETRGAYLMLVGQGHLWILVALLSEVVNTFILADFCYYYVKSVMEGQVIMRLPTNV